MASSKDMFESHYFRANYYAAGMWRGLGADVPSVPGIEFTMHDTSLHFTIPRNRQHFTVPDTSLHFTTEEH